MKVTQIIAALLAVAGSAAMADDPTVVTDTFTPATTRAEVNAEVLQARHNGQITTVTEIGGQINQVQRAPKSTLTRAEVRRQAIQAERRAPVIYPLA